MIVDQREKPAAVTARMYVQDKRDSSAACNRFQQTRSCASPADPKG